MDFKRERDANKRLWCLIFASIVIVELGWWIAEEVFCEPVIEVDSKGEKEISPNDSFFVGFQDEFQGLFILASQKL